MRATIVGIESGTAHRDGHRRLRLSMDDGDLLNFRNTITINERALGIIGLKLDDEIEVAFGCDAAKIREERKARQ
jgi:hypothetical protein